MAGKKNQTKPTERSVTAFINQLTDKSGREGDRPLIAISPSKELWANLRNHTTGKGFVYIKKLAYVDGEVLRELLAKSVAATRID